MNHAVKIRAATESQANRKEKSMARRRYQRGTLEKRGDRWFGRYLDDVIQGDGTIKRVHRRRFIGDSKQFPTKKLAMRELEKLVGDAGINTTGYRPKRTSTFAEFAVKWQRDTLTQLKPSTQSAAKSHLKCVLLAGLGHIELANITPELLQQQMASWTCTAKTKHNLMATVRSIWRTAKSQGYVSHNPFDGLTMPQIVHTEQRCFTAEEMRRIFAAAEEPYKSLYMLAADTGLRGGELCGLTWENIDLDNGVVFVVQGVWRRTAQTLKSKAGLRTVTLSPELTEHLRSRIGSGFLFVSKDGRPMSQYFVVQRKLSPLLKALEIPAGGLHAFRHANASLMARAGVSIKCAQERLGHSDSRLTLKHYTHVVSEDSRKASASLGRILYPAFGTESGNGSGGSSQVQ